MKFRYGKLPPKVSDEQAQKDLNEIKEGRPAYRGVENCWQDRCENCPFASIGGLDHRGAPLIPYWVKPGTEDDYLYGYVRCAQVLYGEDWQTAEFGWSPALTIGEPS